MQIRILKPGLLSTIQDHGRLHFLSQAVPLSGAMDSLSMRIANKAVGNNDNEAVIEFTYSDAAFKAETDLLLSYAGNGMQLYCGIQFLPSNRPLFIPAGNMIQMKYMGFGARIYVAIAGGWDIPEVLGSKSTNLAAEFGGFKGRALQVNDRLDSQASLSVLSQMLLKKLRAEKVNFPCWSISTQKLLPTNKKYIRVVLGREISWFDRQSILAFLSEPYRLSRNSNRMGSYFPVNFRSL